MALPGIIAAALPILGGIAGQAASSGARSNAEADAKRALETIQGVNLPDIEKMRLALEGYQNVGSLTPQMEAASLLGETNLANIQQDPKFNQYTMDALKKMADVSERGLTEVDRAQLQQMLNANATQNQANQKAILENRQARGMGGSGDELAAALSSAQSSANRGSNEAMQLAALAAQRKMDATSNLGSMVQAAQNADYQRQAALQGQRDAIAEFNARQQQGVQQRNVGSQNAAQLRNLENQQNLSNRNVDLRNQQQQFNRGLEQQQFGNAMQRAGALSGAYQGMSNFNQNQANATANMYSGIGRGAAGIAGAMAMNQPKTDVNTGMTDNDPDTMNRWTSALNRFGQG